MPDRITVQDKLEPSQSSFRHAASLWSQADNKWLLAQRAPSALPAEFGDSPIFFDSKDSTNEQILIAAKPKSEVPGPEKFPHGEYLTAFPKTYLPTGRDRVGLREIQAKHTPLSELRDKPKQGIFNTSEPDILKQLVSQTIQTADVVAKVKVDSGEVRTVYQAPWLPKQAECGLCSDQPVGYVSYGQGRARVPAYFVNVVVNEKGVILDAYPSDTRLKEAK